MEVKYHCKYDKLVTPEELTTHPRNANMHPEEQIDALCRFIRVSGFRQPVTVSNLSGCIVAGHARRLAAKRVGCDCPTVYQDFDTEADEVAFLLADNRLAELAVTDDDALQGNLDFLDEGGFDLGDIGFDMDIDLGVDEVNSGATGNSTGKGGEDRAAMDEIRVFVLSEKRIALFEVLKSFACDNGESSVRWQKS